MIDNHMFNPYMVSCLTVNHKNHPIQGKSLGFRTVRWYELLYFPESNNGHTLINGRTVPNPSGSIMFRMPGTPMESISTFSAYNIAIDPIYDPTLHSYYKEAQLATPTPELIKLLQQKNCPIFEQLPESLTISLPNQTRCETLFREAFTLHLTRPATYLVKSRRIIYEIIDLILDEKAVQTTSIDHSSFLMTTQPFDPITLHQDEAITKHNQTLHRLIQSKNYIDNHLTKPLTLAILANQSGYSKEAYCRLFKKHFHISPINYLINLRIIYAKKLLLTTDESLEIIAQQTGFNSHIHFSHTFKKNVGIPPGKYRHNHQLFT